MEKKTFSLKEARKATQSIIRRNKTAIPVAPANAITAGPVSQAIPCPSPQAIDLLRVEKVFNECRIVDTNEVIDAVVNPPAGAVDVECLGAQLIGTPSCTINPDNETVTVTFSFATAYQFLDNDGDPVGDIQVIETLNETRTIFLERAGETGLGCVAEIFLECIECFVSEFSPTGIIEEVTCCVGKQIIVKLTAIVQLLIPTFGYAPEPPECEQVAGECPDFVPVWPPYPPQDPDFPPLGNTQGNCGCKNKRK